MRVVFGVIAMSVTIPSTRDILRTTVRYSMSVDFDDHFNLNGDIRWQGFHSDGRPRVATNITEHFQEEIGAAVDNRWMFGELWSCIHQAKHLEHSCHTIQRHQM